MSDTIVLVLSKAEYQKLERIDPGVRTWLKAGTELMKECILAIEKAEKGGEKK